MREKGHFAVSCPGSPTQGLAKAADGSDFNFTNIKTVVIRLLLQHAGNELAFAKQHNCIE
jgi:hypothetical protein